ncbi:HEPN domain-containing protein [Niastella vici]|uniref:HEPN domain-containing protein n=1 Tax=Niastella vici TaxID=1703345 RepID=UPI00117F6162|nr:HEPN domain-containing protein [Niastella vici]
MKSSLKHLPEDKQKEIKAITESVVQLVMPEKIILFGSYATGKWQEDRHIEGHVTYEYVSDYDMLVVTRKGDTRPEHQIQELSETKSQPLTSIPINIIVHGIDYVNRQIEEGQFFFTDIKKEGILLYDAGSVDLAEQRELSVTERRIIAERDFDKYFNSGENLLEFAESASKKKKALNDAVFLLHQSAERFYNTIMLVFTGYKPKTHNLGKLLKMSREFSPELSTVFPNNSKNEIHLFTLLKKAYVDARYNDKYIITEEELTTLIEKVKKLQDIIERVCKNKIASIA